MTKTPPPAAASWRHCLLITSLLSLTACSGGGGGAATAVLSSPAAPTGPTLAGVVDFGMANGAVPTDAIVCVDLNADLACGGDEARAAVGTGGVYAVPSPMGSEASGLTLVATWPDPQSGQATTLVAPGSAGVINALTTLAWASRPAGESADARAAWLQSLGLPAGLDIEAANDAAVRQLNVALVPGLGRAEQAIAAAMPGTDFVRPAATALIGVLPRYLDPATGHFYPTVSGRTLGSEAAYWALGSLECKPPRIDATMTIDTVGAAPIVSREDYLTAVLTVTTNDGVVEQLPTRIRGRGNSTWAMPKKPYRLKLDTKAALLGMPANRDWTLLANYSDKTLMRNALAFCVGRMMGFVYTPDSRFIELTVNGDYVGVFQVSDQIEVATSRVDIDDEVKSPTDGDLGFLIELDQYLDPADEVWFRTPSGLPFAIKSDIEASEAPLVADYMARFETALFGAAFLDPAEGYPRYLEADTLVDFYLVNEFLRNNDAFLSSTYLHRPRGGRLAFGPLWDFDRSTGNALSGNDSPEGWWVRQTSTYAARLIDHDPQFRHHLNVRWNYLQSRLPDLQAFLAAGASGLDAAQARNFVRWPILGTIVWPNPADYGSYAGEVNHLHNWLTLRATWMNNQLRNP